MSFEVTADAYAQFMGRFSEPLAVAFADRLGIRQGQTALDVGCGTGALTEVLVSRLGTDRVAAVDPSESFVAAMRQRFPAMDVRQATAEHLPDDIGRFDVVAAQLVVHFMTDPVRGLSNMARVARPGGVVGATVWDHAGGAGPLAAFWAAVRDMDPAARDEATLPGAAEGHLAELFTQAGFADVVSTALTVRVGHATFDEWWRPFTLGVGPAGSYVGGLDRAGRTELRERCRALLPEPPFHTEAVAWTVWSPAPAR